MSFQKTTITPLKEKKRKSSYLVTPRDILEGKRRQSFVNRFTLFVKNTTNETTDVETNLILLSDFRH